MKKADNTANTSRRITAGGILCVILAMVLVMLTFQGASCPPEPDPPVTTTPSHTHSFTISNFSSTPNLSNGIAAGTLVDSKATVKSTCGHNITKVKIITKDQGSGTKQEASRTFNATSVDTLGVGYDLPISKLPTGTYDYTFYITIGGVEFSKKQLSFVVKAAASDGKLPQGKIFNGIKLQWPVGYYNHSYDEGKYPVLQDSNFGYRPGGAGSMTKNGRKYHFGIDMTNYSQGGIGYISNVYGQTVRAAAAGTVTYSKGCMIIIKHNNNSGTGYLHLSSRSVKKGATVKQGDIIGKVGDQNGQYAPHLHFEVYYDSTGKFGGTQDISKTVDPLKYFNQPNGSAYKYFEQ